MSVSRLSPSSGITSLPPSDATVEEMSILLSRLITRLCKDKGKLSQLPADAPLPEGFCPQYFQVDELLKCTERKERKYDSIDVERPLSSKGPPVPAMAFGEEAWFKYLGNIGEEPPLPADIFDILKGPCPFGEGTIGDNFFLTVVPKYVNQKKLTLKWLGTLVQKPHQGGHPTAYETVTSAANRGLSVGQSKWVLVSRNVLPGSCGKSFRQQVRQVQDLSKKRDVGYKVGHLFEICVSFFAHHVKDGKYPSLQTRCYMKNERGKLRHMLVTYNGKISVLDENSCAFPEEIGMVVVRNLSK